MTEREPPTDANVADPSVPATYHEQAHYPLEIGQVVYDIRGLVTATNPHEEPGEAVVVDTHPPATSVHTHSFSDDGRETILSDYHLNRLYADFSASERVVTIAWDSLLDGLAPQWREHRNDPAAMQQYFDDLADGWDVALPARKRTYDYPESRLIAAADVPESIRP